MTVEEKLCAGEEVEIVDAADLHSGKRMMVSTVDGENIWLRKAKTRKGEFAPPVGPYTTAQLKKILSIWPD